MASNSSSVSAAASELPGCDRASVTTMTSIIPLRQRYYTAGPPPGRARDGSREGTAGIVIAVSPSATAPASPKQVPLVEYLELGDPPTLMANECTNCGARYFDRRVACASCEGTEFSKVAIPREGEVRAFTIVSMAAPGIPVPFVAALIDCGGTSVKANLINVTPDDKHVTLGMKVRLATYSLGADSDGTEAVGFGFEPVA